MTHVHGGLKIYGTILAALMTLTVITVAASYVHFGSGMINVVIALGIATMKASLVALFFMHLRWDKPMNGIILLTGLAFLSVFLFFCFIDADTRDVVRPSNLKVSAPALSGSSDSAR